MNKKKKILLLKTSFSHHQPSALSLPEPSQPRLHPICIKLKLASVPPSRSELLLLRGSLHGLSVFILLPKDQAAVNLA